MRSLYVILGDPVAHSRSPKLHARAFAELGVDAVYAPCHVRDLPAAFAGLKALGVAGGNVTVPHKEGAARLCDKLEKSAFAIGAVNCFVRADDAIVGHNTDAPGLLRALRAHGVDAAGLKAAIIGAGGAARAAAWALAGSASQLRILNRTAEKAKSLASLVRASGCAAETAPLDASLRDVQLVVQCTSIGLGTDELPIDPAQLGADCVLVDLVYAPGGPTALLRKARCKTIDGIDVLVHQAIASLEIWLRRPQLDELAPTLRKAALE